MWFPWCWCGQWRYLFLQEREENQRLRGENESLHKLVQQLQPATDELSKQIHQLEHVSDATHRQFSSERNRLNSLMEGERREKEAAQKELQQMQKEKEDLQRQVGALEKEIAEHSFGGSYSNSSATPMAFEAALAHTNEALQSFSSALVVVCSDMNFAGLFKSGKYVFARSLHWKLALRSLLCNLFFTNFGLESFGVHDYTESLDAKEFREDCFEEYKQLLHGKDEELLCDWKVNKFANEKAREVCNFIPRNIFSTSEGQPNQELMQKFKKVVLSVWKLHKLAFSFYPAARILKVCQGMKMNSAYMESVLSGDDIDGDEFTFGDEEKIAFSIFPGFTIRKSVFKCQVYPALIRK